MAAGAAVGSAALGVAGKKPQDHALVTSQHMPDSQNNNNEGNKEQCRHCG